MPVLRIVDIPVVRLRPATATISGTVTDGTNPLRRQIVVFQNRALSLFAGTTFSGGDGNWSATVLGAAGSNFTVVAVGLPGENSQIFADVVGY